MNRSPRWIALLCLMPLLAAAQSSGGVYVMRKQVIAAGGSATGAALQLTGTAAQPAAGVSSAGSYRLTHGFHQGRQSAPVVDFIFANGFQ
jgi:hypothetical protein